MKDFVVLFDKETVRIIKGDLRPYKGLPNAIFNPDLSIVKGIPPHLWSIKDLKQGKRDDKFNYINLLPVATLLLGLLLGRLL